MITQYEIKRTLPLSSEAASESLESLFSPASTAATTMLKPLKKKVKVKGLLPFIRNAFAAAFDFCAALASFFEDFCIFSSAASAKHSDKAFCVVSSLFVNAFPSSTQSSSALSHSAIELPPPAESTVWALEELFEDAEALEESLLLLLVRLLERDRLSQKPGEEAKPQASSS